MNFTDVIVNPFYLLNIKDGEGNHIKQLVSPTVARRDDGQWYLSIATVREGAAQKEKDDALLESRGKLREFLQ